MLHYLKGHKMSKEPEPGEDSTRAEDPKFDASANRRAGWVLIVGLGGMLMLLVVVELLRRI
jgi:hypothetical protein